MTFFEILMIESIGSLITSHLAIEDVTALDHVFSQMRKYRKRYQNHSLVVNWLSTLSEREVLNIAKPVGALVDEMFTALNVGRVTIVSSVLKHLVVAPKTRFKYDINVPILNEVTGKYNMYEFSVFYKHGIFTSFFNLQLIIMQLRHGERLRKEAERALFSFTAQQYFGELKVCTVHYLCYLKSCGLKLHRTTGVHMPRGSHLSYEVATYHMIEGGHPRFITTGYSEPADLFDDDKDVNFCGLFYTYGLPPLMVRKDLEEEAYFYPDIDLVMKMLTGISTPLELRYVAGRTNVMSGGGAWIDRYLGVTLPQAIRTMGLTSMVEVMGDENLEQILAYVFVDTIGRSAAEIVSGTYSSINNIRGRNATNRMCNRLLNKKDVELNDAAKVWSNLSLTHLRRGCIVERD
jgi:hypothetical protein